MSNSEARKRQAANEPSADVEALGEWWVTFDGPAYPTGKEFAQAFLASDWLTAHTAAAEARGAERALRDLYASFTGEDSDLEVALMGGELVRVRILDAIDEATS